jgi:methyl-accepting chemotaxis protein-1 (serine sensor receptor)
MASFKLSVKARLTLLIATLVALTAVVGIMGVRELARANDSLHDVFHYRLVPIVWIDRIAGNMRDNVIALDATLARGDDNTLQSFIASTKSIGVVNDEIWKKYQETPMTPAEAELAQAYRESLLKYREKRGRVVAGIAEGKLHNARMERRELQAEVQAMIAAGQALTDFQEKNAEEANTLSDRQHARATLVAWLLIGISMVTGAISGWLLIRSMLRALSVAVAASERIALGELGRTPPPASADEFGRLLAALKTMDERLSQIVGSVRSAADSVGSAARQISNGNDDLSQRTQEQASALEETAASMEEMTATVKQNADNARSARELAAAAHERANRGGDIVSRAVTAMQEINGASNKIADIIAVIDGIAFQTNLLALNAAVEAARAGEQGRGFAVVASEVRSLAQRSAAAAKEIKGLIGDSVAKVAAGSELVQQSGTTLEEIIASVKKVTDIVAEISAASDEQATGIDQVNRAVTEMDSVTQQNAALVEEASAASKAMEQQAGALIDKITFFHLADGQGASESRSVAPAHRSPPALQVPQARDALAA